ncbi:MAG: PAS domain-containing protein [Bacteroidales bacterium]|nr:PAS domain-containing protein [Bacteroidales bacterium]
MDRKYSKSFVFRYTLIGVFVGLFLLFFIFLIEALIYKIALTLPGVLELHRVAPILYFLDLLPFLFATISYYFVRYVSIVQTELNDNLETELSRQRKLYRFVEKLRGGDIDADYVLDESDILGKSIVNLRDNLKVSKQEEITRRNEDEQRNWIAEGMAKFGEILRSDNDNMEELSYQVISNLVKYIDANQGGFYLLEDNDPGDKHFLQTACYAYERRKFADQRVEWGEGIVGTCALEAQTIFLKKVPDSYLNITSGLGRANPKCLLVVPLKVRDEIHGVLEIATFNVFEKYQIDFIEKVAESIASTIATVKINIRTSKLLRESQNQSEILAAQEEQMRQNMEELQATQEEASRQAEKFISFTNSVNHTLIRAEYDVNGTLLYANTRFLNKLEYSSNSEVEGKHIYMFINKKDRLWFDDLWKNLAKGGKHFEGDMKHVTRSGKDLWTIATYTCVRNQFGGVEKVLFLAIDTTDQKKQSLDFEGQINALNISSIKSEFSPTGELLDANEKFLATTGYNFHEAKTKSIYDFVAENDRKNLERIWDDLTHGISFEGPIKFLTKADEKRWFRVTFSVVKDMYEEIAKVIFIANDITREKVMEKETKEQTERLMVQEDLLRQNEVELNRKLRQAREEVKNQFKEIEKAKIRNEKILEGFLDAVVITDQDGIVNFFNNAAEQLFEVSKSYIIGQNIRLLFPNEIDGKDEFLDAYLDPQKQKIVGQRREINITSKSGKEIPVLMLLSETKIGREITYTAFIQNISVDLF